jgi:hypothetical protein
METTDLKSFICNLYMNLNQLIDTSSAISTKESSDQELSPIKEDDIECILKLPFESIYKELNSKFVTQIKRINYCLNYRANDTIHNTLNIESVHNPDQNHVKLKNAFRKSLTFDQNSLRSVSPSSISSCTSIDSNSKKNYNSEVTISKIESDSDSNQFDDLIKEKYQTEEELSDKLIEKMKLDQEKKSIYQLKLKLEQQSKAVKKMSNDLSIQVI